MAVIGDQVVEVGLRSASVLCELVSLCAAFDESREWVSDASPTAAHWIAQRLDVEICTAREWLRIGKRLRDLPMTQGAFRSQQLSYSKVRATTRFATPDNEAQLCEIARTVPAGMLNRVLAAWSLKNEGQEVVRQRQHTQRGVFLSTQPDGSLLAIVRLPALPGARAQAAIDASVMANKPDASADACPSLAQQRADALVRLLTEGPAKLETEVIVHVRGDGATLDDGTPIAGSLVEEIAPHSFIRALIHDAGSRPINASGRRRHPTERQKRVVKERDRACVMCGSSDFGQYDHFPDYDVTKHTVIDELQYLCAACHRLRHKGAA